MPAQSLDETTISVGRRISIRGILSLEKFVGISNIMLWTLRDKIVYNGTKGLDAGSFSDGKMYDETSRLCMEHAQDVMISEGNLE